jgi:hypothetical protein
VHRVKIGRTTGSAERRRGELQTGAPCELILLGAVEADEAAMHRRFMKSRFAGEWFNITPEIDLFIRRKFGPGKTINDCRREWLAQRRNEAAPSECTELIRPEEAAKSLQISVRTLANWRCRREGPPFVKCGNAVRYSKSDLRDYIRTSRVDVSSHLLEAEVVN